ISLYQVSFDEKWLDQANKLTEYCLEHFFDHSSGMFFFTSSDDPDLIARKTEIFDNVIPSSNSSMAKALFYLGKLFDNDKYLGLSRQMLSNVQQLLSTHLQSSSNWGILQLNFAFDFYEVAVVGENYLEKARELMQSYLPNSLILASAKQAEIPLLNNKYKKDQTLIYLCKNKVCQAPVLQIEEAKKLILNH